MGHLGEVRHCLINDLPTLIWAINLAAIELHTTLGRVEDVDCPTMMAFDLDPGEGMDLKDCAEVARLLKDLLDRSGLESFPKTSGKKGLHVFVPINTPTNYQETKGLAHSTAEHLERRHPDFIVSRMAKKLRVGKIFIDWSQNTDFKTTTTVYSVRANNCPTVSTPITWKELLSASRKSSEARRLLAFETEEVLKRIEKHGDLFEGVLKLNQRLPSRMAKAA
jgi:bifunctional non-homologous end joining protein LigD